jgi:hypothetical protein
VRLIQASDKFPCCLDERIDRNSGRTQGEQFRYDLAIAGHTREGNRQLGIGAGQGIGDHLRQRRGQMAGGDRRSLSDSKVWQYR